MADVAPRCGSLPRQRRGGVLDGNRRSRTSRRPGVAVEVTISHALWTFLLLTVLLQLWIPATMAADVVPQSSREKEVGDQVTPSEVAETSTEGRQQLRNAQPPIPSLEPIKQKKSQKPLKPLKRVKPLTQHSQSRLAASTTRKNATQSRKTRRGPKPRVRLIKVYKKVWRERKPPRKPGQASHSPVSESEELENVELLSNTQKDVSTTAKSIEQDKLLQTSDVLKNESGNPQSGVSPSDAQVKSHNHQQNASIEKISSRSLDYEKVPEDSEIKIAKNESLHQDSSSLFNDYSTKLALTSTTYEPNTITPKRTLSNRRKSTSRIKYSKVDSSQSTIIPTTLLDYDTSESTTDSYSLYSTPATTEDKLLFNTDYVTSGGKNPLSPMNSSNRKLIQHVEAPFHRAEHIPSSTESQTDSQSITPNIETKKYIPPMVEDSSSVTSNIPSIKDIYGPSWSKENVDNLNKQEDYQSTMIHEIDELQLKPKESTGFHKKSHESVDSYLKDYDATFSASNSYDIVAAEGSVKESLTLPPHTHEELHEKITQSVSLNDEQKLQEERKVGSKKTMKSLEVPSRSQNEQPDALDPSHIETEDPAQRPIPYLDTTETASLPTENELVAFDICKLSLYDFYNYAITSPHLLMLPLDIHCGFTLNQNYIQAYSPYGNGYQKIANNYFIPLPSIPLTIRGLVVPESFKPWNLKPQMHSHHLTNCINTASALQQLDETFPRPNIYPSGFPSIFSPDISNYHIIPLYVDNNFEKSKSIKGSIPKELEGAKLDYSGISITPPNPKDSLFHLKSSTTQPISQMPQSQLFKSRSQLLNLYPKTLQQPKEPKYQHQDFINFPSRGIPREEPDRYSPNAYIPSVFGDQYEKPVVKYPTTIPRQSFQTKHAEEEPISSSISMVGPARSHPGDHKPRNKNLSPHNIPFEEPSLKFIKDDRPSYTNFPEFDRDIFSILESSLPKEYQPFSSTPPLSAGRFETPFFHYPSDKAEPLIQTNPSEYKPYSEKLLGPSYPISGDPKQSYFQNRFLPGIPFVQSPLMNPPNPLRQIPPDYALGNTPRMGSQQLKTYGLPQDRNIPLGMSVDRNPLLRYPWKQNSNSADPGVSDVPMSPDITEQRRDLEEELDTSKPTTENPCLLGLRLLRDRVLGRQHNHEDGNKRKHRRRLRHRSAGLS